MLFLLGNTLFGSDSPLRYHDNNAPGAGFTIDANAPYVASRFNLASIASIHDCGCPSHDVSRGSTGIAVGVGVAVAVNVRVGLGVLLGRGVLVGGRGVIVRRGVLVGAGVLLGVLVLVGVRVIVGVRVFVGVLDGGML